MVLSDHSPSYFSLDINAGSSCRRCLRDRSALTTKMHVKYLSHRGAQGDTFKDV